MQKIHIQKNFPLHAHNTLRAGGPARYFFCAENIDDIQNAVFYAREKKLPIVVIGEGSNVLISDDGIPALVLKINTKGITWEEDDKNYYAEVSAGENWDTFVEKTVEKNISGLENLSLIPGSVGAAPVQNIGAYGTEVKSNIKHVSIFDTETCEFKKLSNEECTFGYRDSIFKKQKGSKFIVTGVTFVFPKATRLNISYKDVQKYFKEKNVDALTPRDVRNAVIDIRTRKLPDIYRVGTAGSFFKNPIVSKYIADKLQKKYPDIPMYVLSDGAVKLSAAWIIDHIGGWKNVREGNVGTHALQPLALVNYGEKNAKEIFSFAKKIQKDIYQKTKIKFEFEIKVLGAI